MKRFLSIALVSVTAMLGLSSAQTPVQAKVPRAKGEIAFARRIGDSGPDIITVNPDGADPQQVPLPQSPETFAIPVWSPDRRHLLISNLNPYDDFYSSAIVDPDGSSFRLLANGDWPVDVGYCSVWTNDGSRLLCQDESGVVSIRSSDGCGFEQLTVNPFGGGDVPTDVSPVGSRYVFMRFRPGPRPDQRNQQSALFVANVDGGGIRQLTPFGLTFPHIEFASAQWSPDGGEVISSTGQGRLFAVRVDGKGMRPIQLDLGTQQYFGSEPDWSPDGSQIVFGMFLNGQEDLFTANADGSNVVQITDTPEFENGPDWGPAAI